MASSFAALRILRKQIIPYSNYALRSRATPVLCQYIHSCSRRLASEAEFDAAKERLSTLKEDPGNEVKLKIYSLFKQANTGPCDTPKPSAFDFVGKVKWTAWNELGTMTKDEARQEYINTVDTLVQAEGGPSSSEAEDVPSDDSAFKNIIYEVVGKAAKITLNRPKNKNALTTEMYNEISAALKKAGEDKNVRLAVLTGSGDYYCSGNDLNNFASIQPDQIKQVAEDGGTILEGFVNSFIDFPKPLIAAVNGPAIGVAVTTLGLCDVVYASDTASFKTPFPALGQSPEGCSSYIFPKIMGAAKASEVLLFGRKLSAQDAKERGLVADIFKADSFHSEITRRVAEYSELPPMATVESKNMIRKFETDTLKKVNKAECDLLVKLWQRPECFEAIMNFFSDKN